MEKFPHSEPRQSQDVSDSLDKNSDFFQKAEVEPLYGHCYEISDIKNNDVLPVGGNALFSGETVQLKCDFENLQVFLSKTKDMTDKVPLDNLKKWLIEAGIEVDVVLFANLFAFTKQ